MIVITENTNLKNDEGYLKLSNTLCKKLSQKGAEVLHCVYSDEIENENTIKVNKLFYSKKMISRTKGEDVIYICQGPSLGKIVKLLTLKYFCKCKNITLLLCQVQGISFICRKILMNTKANIIVLSEKTQILLEKYKLKPYLIHFGVDTNQFVPVEETEKQRLREKYDYKESDKIILHVGHLNKGRNVEKFASIPGYKKILVVSSSTQADLEIKQKLEGIENLTIIDSYIQNIEEIYQLVDCYVFLVENSENCIDIPFSVLEAAACNLPIVSTNFKDLKKFEGETFIISENTNPQFVEEKIREIIDLECDNSEKVRMFDWDKNINKMISIARG